MKNLFNKYEAYTKKGGELSDELIKVLDPIFKEWAEDGYKVKDIESITFDQTAMLCAVIRAKRGVAAAEAARAEERNKLARGYQVIMRGGAVIRME